MNHRALIMLICLALTAAASVLLPSAAGSERVLGMAPMMQVTGGVADYQVLQRDDHDKAVARVVGRCYPQAGVIEARLCDRGVPVVGLDWRKAGTANEGEWKAELPELPVGGPYDLEVRLLGADGKPAASAAVRHLLVGDLWILAGQSNMQGVGKVSELPPPLATAGVFGMDDRWRLGQEPLHPLLESRDQAHYQGREALAPEGVASEEWLLSWRQQARAPDAESAGPGLPFAWELYRLTGVPVGLIPCARGGTTLENWSPARKDEGGDSLYGAMVRRAAAAGGKIRGVLWYQGESDALAGTADTYQERFVDFVAAVRADLDDPDLYFLYVQIGRVVVMMEGMPAGWDKVREAQRLAEPQLERAALVPAVDATMNDMVHLDTAGQMLVGRRLALQAAREVFGRADIRRGPRLREALLDEKRITVTLRLEEVNGRLCAQGRAFGFSISDESGSEVLIIRRVDLPADRPDTIELHLAYPLPEGAQLWYGRGLDPCANLTDERDMGMLTFGPVAIPFPAK